MSETNDGGPVAPTYQSGSQGAACNTTFEPRGGLMLRDYFAAKALITIAADVADFVRETNVEQDIAEIIGDGARLAYQIADAMLEERAKRGAR